MFVNCLKARFVAIQIFHCINLNCIFFRKAFELAKKSPGCVFGTRGDIDVEKIKQSKYFRAILQQPNGVSGKGLVMFFCVFVHFAFVCFLLYSFHVIFLVFAFKSLDILC